MPPSAIIEDFQNSLPHRRLEAWRWTDGRAAVDGALVGLQDKWDGEITVQNGSVTTSPITDQDHSNDHIMSALASRYCGVVHTVEVKAGETETMTLSNINQGHGRIVIKVGAGATLNLTETHDSTAPSFVNLDMQIDLAKGATINRTIWQDDDAASNRYTTTHINAWAGAVVRQFMVGFGAKLARFDTQIAGLGEDLNIHMGAAYLLKQKRHIDMTSHIDLTAPNAVINQTVKGMVDDSARGVFQGKFHVRRPAQLTDAKMRHDALMLSDKAEIRAKPELEIYADDVACAHGNTIGALDESSLFYMRQRGIPLAKARALLIEAFLASAFDEADTDVRDQASGKIENWLAL